MFYDDRSDFGALIAGFLFLALIPLGNGILAINYGFELGIDPIPALGSGIRLTLLVVGIIIAGISLAKGYITEGITFGLVGVMLVFDHGTISAIILIILFAFLAIMSYFDGQLDLLGYNILLGAAAFMTRGFDDQLCVGIAGIIMLVAAALAFFICFMAWRDTQDYFFETECAMLDDECCCEGECHCNDEKKE